MNVTATLSVEEAKDREATWIEEAIFYSLGNGWILQWLDRWLFNPILQVVVSYKGTKVFRRLQAHLEKPHAESILGSDQAFKSRFLGKKVEKGGVGNEQ